MTNDLKATIILTNNLTGVRAYLRTRYGSESPGYFNIRVYLLRDYCKGLLLPELLKYDYSILTEMEQLEIVMEVLNDLDKKLKYFNDINHSINFPNSLLRFINNIKLSGLEPDDLNKPKNRKKWNELKEILSVYNSKLKKRGKIDYSDLLKLFLNKLEDGLIKLSTDIEYQIDNQSFEFKLEKDCCVKLGGNEFSLSEEEQKNMQFFYSENPDEELNEVLRDIVFNKSEDSLSQFNIVLPDYRARINQVYNMLERYGINAVYLKGVPISANKFGRFLLRVLEYMEDNRCPQRFIGILLSDPVKLHKLADM
ncbi:UvrD-helicase domain-containing protein, partial [Candidatus Dependentiae bacterium]|nr:UvrD-helicase domain-containing protein [Candidatus Dependentiae bacterium]